MSDRTFLEAHVDNGWDTIPTCPYCEANLLNSVGTYLYDYCKECHNRITVVKQRITIYKVNKDNFKTIK